MVFAISAEIKPRMETELENMVADLEANISQVALGKPEVVR